MSFHEKTRHAARGKWRGILQNLGVPEACLHNKHGPCPLCESKDNFRWDNKEGAGTYICTCGAGDGLKLAMEFTGQSFTEIAPQVDAMVGNLKPDPEGYDKTPTTEDARAQCVRIWNNSVQLQPGDLAHKYLQSRGVEENVAYPKSLRFARALADGDGGLRPAMIALVGVPGAPRFSGMHRTFLKPDGSGKAEMASPRKLAVGTQPDGACVALSDYTGGVLGVAEGIETALAASALFDMPVWATLNTALMKRWLAPDGCREVVIFGDNDPKFGGQAAAYELAHRLAVKGVSVSISLPRDVGTDWNDVLLENTRQEGAA